MFHKQASQLFDNDSRQDKKQLKKEPLLVSFDWLAPLFRDIWLQKSQVLDSCYLEENHTLKSCIAWQSIPPGGKQFYKFVSNERGPIRELCC